VRCRAAELLGSLDGVHRHTLIQSLYKKSLTEVAGAFVAPSVELVVDEEVSQWTLQGQQVPGAFVHALEEEFWEVRMAALNSICELSLRSDEFARHALVSSVCGVVCLYQVICTKGLCGGYAARREQLRSPQRHSLAASHGGFGVAAAR
jgi:hypothetical protein